ncbi:hypothetical protein [Psychrobacter ciconiae]|nr:hypothetical protein [Psychrobacter ciconiae]
MTVNTSGNTKNIDLENEEYLDDLYLIEIVKERLNDDKQPIPIDINDL